MKVLVTGYGGQLGYDVVERLKCEGITCRGIDINDFDLRDENATKSFIRNYTPDIIVHCAAYTAVDKAEENKELCHDVNVLGTKYIAEIAKEVQAKLVYISTDYVFPGNGELPYEVDDETAPINRYGMSKWKGEQVVRQCVPEHFIIRISWVFGVNGNNFVKAMLRLSETRKELSVVADQIGSPTYTYDLAFLISKMIQTDKYGTYHATNEGVCSWYDFAIEIFRIAGIEINLTAIPSENYPTPAKRPKNSRLSKRSLDNAGFERLPSWQSALQRFIEIME